MREGSHGKQASHGSLHSGGGRQQRETQAPGFQAHESAREDRTTTMFPRCRSEWIFAMCAGESPEQGSEQGGKSPWIQEGVFLKGFIHFHFFFFLIGNLSWPQIHGLSVLVSQKLG